MKTIFLDEDVDEERPCKGCGGLLPISEPGGKRELCDECRKENRRNNVRECEKRRRRRKQFSKNHPPKNLLLHLGMDYVTMKLAGQIYIPHRGKQIRIEKGHYDQR